jgi:mycothiol synthase
MSDTPPTIRPYRGEHDNTTLATIAQRLTHEPYSPQKIAYELTMPGTNLERDVAICENPQGQVIGYVCVNVDDVRDVRQGRVTYRIPTETEAERSAARDVLLWTARRMYDELETTDRPLTIVEMVKETDQARCEFLELVGFRAIRYYFTMRLEDAKALSELTLPPAHSYLHGPGREGAEEYVAMFNETWVDHYGFVPLTVERYMHDLDEDPEYDPSLDIVLVKDARRYVGFSFCRVYPSDPATGEVMVIGIRRGHRNNGLGRVLLTHSVRALVERGAKSVELAVDAESPTGAGRLYESVGFKVISMKRRYQLEHNDIIRIATLDSC